MILHGQSSNTDAGVWGENSDGGPGVLGSSTSGPGVEGVSPSSNGVRGRSDTTDAVLGRSSSGNGVRGQSGAGNGVVGASSTNNGVAGLARTPGKSGVFGTNTVFGGNGVAGISQDGTGVYGKSTTGVGVRAESEGDDALSGRSAGPGKSGVFGFNGSDGGNGVVGISMQGNGVYGRSESGPGLQAESGSNDGVFGHTRAPGRSGVFGYNPNEGGNGVAGISEQGNGMYARSSAGVGVFAESGRNDGVFGRTSVPGKSGVVGINSSAGGNGVAGISEQGAGVYGRSPFGSGVYGVSYRAGLRGEGQGSGVGVFGRADGTTGVLGHADNGNGVTGSSLRADINGAAVVGISRRPDYSANLHGYAGVFIGKVYVAGELEKGGGGFKIDHPLDPANSYLNHSFVESDTRKNIYDGTVVLDQQGSATVALPPWFELLNRDLRYQLTAIGAPAPELHIAAELADGRFQIAGGRPGLKVCWQVSGTRQDAWAQEFPLVVEQPKPAEACGTLLHPRHVGEQPGIGWGDQEPSLRRLIEEQAPPLDEPAHGDEPPPTSL